MSKIHLKAEDSETAEGGRHAKWTWLWKPNDDDIHRSLELQSSKLEQVGMAFRTMHESLLSIFTRRESNSKLEDAIVLSQK